MIFNDKYEHYESIIVRLFTYNMISTFISDPSASSEQKIRGRLRIIIEPYEIDEKNRYMYLLDIRLPFCKQLENAKEFETIRTLHTYIKLNKEKKFRFQEKEGDGFLYVTLTKKKTENSREQQKQEYIKCQRFVLESQESKIKRVKEEEQERKKNEIVQMDIEQDPLYPPDTLVFDFYKKVEKGQFNPKDIKKVVVKYCFIDGDTRQNFRMSEWQLQRMGIQNFYTIMNDLQNVQELSIQWLKLCTAKKIKEIIKKFPKLKIINFDNQGNAFSTQNLIDFNHAKYTRLEQINLFFNISEPQNYFDESWWHPQHTENYKGSHPIGTPEFHAFVDQNPTIVAAWIPKLDEAGVELLHKKEWRKLAIGCYENQTLDLLWNNILKPSRRQSQLISLCLTRILDINNQALATIISDNLGTLKYFMLCWCQKETDDGIRPIRNCKNLEYFNLRHNAFIQNNDVRLEYLHELPNLVHVNLDNYPSAKDGFLKLIRNPFSNKNIRYIGLPRNKWVDDDTLKHIGQLTNLTSLNLYNCRGENITSNGFNHLRQLTKLRVLNVGSNNLNLKELYQLVKNFKLLRKLNMSDIHNQKYLREGFKSEKYNKQVQYLDAREYKDEMAKVNNTKVQKILRCVPKLTHLDVRNLGIDDRAFKNKKVVPYIHFIGSNFELSKQMRDLGRRGLIFI